MSETIRHFLNFAQETINALTRATAWLWQPIEGAGWDWFANQLGFEHIAPIMLITAQAVIIILVLHMAHLINVIAG